MPLTDIIDLAWLIMFFAALGTPVVCVTVLWHKRSKVCAIALLVYLLTYIPLTLAGKYAVANHGGPDWRCEWSPRYLVVSYRAPSFRPKAKLTLAGAVYWPCIATDRMLWHRSREVIF